MGFFEKFKKRKFWKKRRDHGKKGESNKEDVERSVIGESSKDVESNLEGQSGKDVELNLLEGNEELKKKLDERDATICGLQEILHEQNIQRTQVEATLRGQIKGLENKVKEEFNARLTVEIKLNWRIRELRLKLEETDSEKKEVESALRDQREYYERKQQERDAKSESVEDAVERVIIRQDKRLEERDIALREHEITLHQLHYDHEVTCLARDTRIGVIEDLKAEIQEHELHMKTVGDNMDCIIKDLSKKLGDAKNEKKEVECALRGKMKKLVAFAAAAWAATVVSFMYYCVN